MKRSLLLSAVVACLVVTACENGSSSSYSSGSGSSSTSSKVDYSRTEREIKVDLKTREQNNPLKYLRTKGTYRKNVFGETVMEGTISSSATLASFKDAKLYITGYSKTKSVVGNWSSTVYEVFRPGKSKSFKIKLNLPRSVKSVGWDISNAVALR